MIFLIHDPKCIFIHIHKTGGQSIRRGFFGEDFTRLGIQIPKEYASLFRFAFVRNPYARLVSAWKMFQRRGCDQTFPQFLQIVLDESIDFRMDGNREGWPRSPECMRHHSLPALHPYNCLQEADFVGRFERFQDDFNLVCDRLGISRGELPHLNKGKQNEHYSQYYTENEKDLVAEHFRPDLEKFGYCFENPADASSVTEDS